MEIIHKQTKNFRNSFRFCKLKRLTNFYDLVCNSLEAAECRKEMNFLLFSKTVDKNLEREEDFRRNHEIYFIFHTFFLENFLVFHYSLSFFSLLSHFDFHPHSNFQRKFSKITSELFHFPKTKVFPR